MWGNFIFHADHDLLAFPWLFCGGLRVAGYYHATQAIEKYLKSLALSVVDPNGVSVTSRNEKWIRTHDLSRLAERVKSHYPYYGQAPVAANLERFAEFDQLARYPWVTQKHGNGFTSADVPVLCDLIMHLRTDIPIQRDDYPLGVIVRGFHQGNPDQAANKHFISELSGAVKALRQLFPDVEKLVRW